MQITEQQQHAASAIVELIVTALGKDRAIHAGTAITSCAVLSGSFLFRSFNISMENISPGNVVLSEEANQKGPVLINVLAWTLSNFGVDLDNNKINKAPKAESNLEFLDALHLLQHKAAAIMEQHKLDFEQMAYSCAMATAFIVKESERDLKIESGFNTAVYGFIEGSKKWPPGFSQEQPKKKSIFKFWK